MFFSRTTQNQHFWKINFHFSFSQSWNQSCWAFREITFVSNNMILLSLSLPYENLYYLSAGARSRIFKIWKENNSVRTKRNNLFICTFNCNFSNGFVKLHFNENFCPCVFIIKNQNPAIRKILYLMESFTVSGENFTLSAYAKSFNFLQIFIHGAWAVVVFKLHLKFPIWCVLDCDFIVRNLDDLMI